MKIVLYAAALCLGLAAGAMGDQIEFKNGDRLTGKIGTLEGTKLTLDSPVAGKVTADMKDIRTFSSDGPIDVVLKDGSVVHEKVNAGPDGQITLAPGGALAAQNIPLTQVTKINPPPEKWSGNVVVGGLLARGNTDSDSLNASGHLVRRGEKDRITLDASYLFARERVPGFGKHETQNDWTFEGKYDYFFTPRLYGYGDARVERDVIAGVDLRLTPGAGAGYQWIDQPNLAFNTEAGVAWIYRSYSHDGSNDTVALRLAYHLTGKINDKISAFHNFEYFPSIERIDNYYFNTDAGLRATLTDKMFSEFKVQYRYDSQPAPGKGPNDLRYILGVGWTFWRRGTHMRRAPSPRRFRVLWRYARVLAGEFRWTLLILLCAVAVGTALHALTPVESLKGHPPSLGVAVYASWMALFAQPTYPPPIAPHLMVMYAVYPVLGFILIGNGVVRLAMLLMSKRAGEKEWMRVVASTYHNHIVLCGLGHLGFRVLEQLIASGTPVVVLERSNSNLFVSEAKALGVPVLIRDMKEDQALVDAGIREAAAVIIASNDDMSNLEVAIDSRRMNPKIRIIMRLFDQKLAGKIAGALTVDVAFSSSALAAPVVAALSLHAKVLSSIMIGDQPHMVAELTVEPGSPLVGQSVSQIEVAHRVRILARTPSGGTTDSAPAGNAILAGDDVLIVHVHADYLSKLAAAGFRSRVAPE